jgi:hypothetical protein
MKSFMYKLAGMAVLAASSPAVFAKAPTCDATDQTVSGGANCAYGGGTPTDLFSGSGAFKTISDTLIFIVGAVSVIMLIIGGLRYVISQGDAAAVKQAKDTILYAIIGIIVAILAFAIVAFIAGAFKPATH